MNPVKLSSFVLVVLSVCFKRSNAGGFWSSPENEPPPISQGQINELGNRAADAIIKYLNDCDRPATIPGDWPGASTSSEKRKDYHFKKEDPVGQKEELLQEYFKLMKINDGTSETAKLHRQGIVKEFVAIGDLDSFVSRVDFIKKKLGDGEFFRMIEKSVLAMKLDKQRYDSDKSSTGFYTMQMIKYMYNIFESQLLKDAASHGIHARGQPSEKDKKK